MTKDDTKKKNEEQKNEYQEKIEQLENQSHSDRDQLKRALADYQNLEKRAKEERVHIMRSSNKDLLLRLLPVLDTLELASKHSEDQSLKVSIQQFLAVLKSEGVIKIETVGKDFDPHTMEVISTVEGSDGKVLEELRAGYIINEKVLRPAQVMVGKGE